MSYLDKHKAYMNINGNSISDQRINETANFINSSFTDDNTYKLVTIDGVTNIDARIEDMTAIIRSNNFITVLDSNKYMLLRPFEGDKCSLGSIVEFENVTWMVTDYNTNDAIFPKGKIERCNSTIDIVTSSNTTSQGKDALGRPIPSVNNIITTLPCIYNGNLTNASMNKEINQPNNMVTITVQYNNTSKLIKENDLYSFYERSYRVKSIDFTGVSNGVGFISFTAERDIV